MEWQGLKSVGRLETETYKKGCSRLERVREDREAAVRRITREQKADDAQRWLQQLEKDFQGAGTFNAAREGGDNLSPVLWALKTYHHNRVVVQGTKEVRDAMTTEVREELKRRGEKSKALEITEDLCDDLGQWSWRIEPAVLVHQDEARGEWSGTFRDPSLMWYVLQAVPGGEQAQLRKVKDNNVATRQEHLASMEALMGNDAAATYLRCRCCEEKGVEHKL
eukprot:2238703-Rhodomonas_salina.2